MAKFTFQDFKGIVPRRGKTLLPPGHAETADYAKLFSGEVKPFLSPVRVVSATKGAGVKTIYLYENAFWLNWLTEVNVALGVAGDDDLKRIYWTGDGAPKKGSLTLVAPDFNGDLPRSSLPMGVAAPSAAPTVLGQGSAGAYVETRNYVYTFVTSWGEESAPSSPSLDVNVKAGESVVVGGMETTAPAGYDTITLKRIYRTVTGADATEYLLVAEIPLADVSYSDGILAADLGDEIATTDWNEPPATLAGLVVLGNGIYAGFVGKDVYLSAQNAPYAWPPGNFFSVEHDIVGLAAMGNSLVVLTRGVPYMFTVGDEADVSQDKLTARFPCVASRTIKTTMAGVAYATTGGVAFIRPGAVEQITKPYYIRSDWQELNPEEMFAEYHDERYYLFYRDTETAEMRGVVLDPVEEMVVTLPINAEAVHADLVRDSLYFSEDGEIYLFDGSALNPATYTYRTNPAVSPAPVTMTALAIYGGFDDIPTAAEAAALAADIATVDAANDAIFADTLWDEGAIGGAPIGEFPFAGNGWQDLPTQGTFELTARLIVDGVQMCERTVVSERPVPLVKNYLGRRFQVELEGTLRVERIDLASIAAEL